MGIIRLAVFGFAALAVIYLLVSIYSKSVRREKLEKKWDAEVKTGDRDAYVEQGLRDYDASLRKRLILLIFVVPVVFVAVLFFLVN